MNGTNGVDFSDLVREENIVCGVKAARRDEAVLQLVLLLHRNEGGIAPQAALEAILTREAAGSTFICPGLAAPHARLPDIHRTLIAIGTAPQGVDFGAGAPEPARVMVLILTPRDDPGAYLSVIAALAGKLADERAVRRLGLCQTPGEVHSLLRGSHLLVPEHLCAEHVMNPVPVTLREGDDLAAAIDAFCRNRVMDIPVIDEAGDLRGVVTIEDVLRLSLPDHLLWMADLSPLLHFEPLAEVLRKDRETRVADFLSDQYVAAQPSTPAIQLVKILINREVRQILVVEGRGLRGVVDQGAFLAQLLWA